MRQVADIELKPWQGLGPRGERIATQHGRLTACVRIKPFILPAVCSREDGVVELEFLFRDSEGVPHRFVTHLGPMELWFPKDPEFVAIARIEGFVADLTIDTMVDDRDEYRIRIDDGRVVCGRRKYTGVRYGLMLRGGILTIQVCWQVIPRPREAPPRDRPSECTAYHVRNLGEFLWQQTYRNLVPWLTAGPGELGVLALARLECPNEATLSLPRSAVVIEPA